jgi:hypothetical protein
MPGAILAGPHCAAVNVWKPRPASLFDGAGQFGSQILMGSKLSQ